MVYAPPPPRKREPVAADAPHIKLITDLCHRWDRDPAVFVTRYLNLTSVSESFKKHPDRAAQLIAERYLCANPIDGRTKELAEVAPDVNEINPDLPLDQVFREAFVQTEKPTTIIQTPAHVRKEPVKNAEISALEDELRTYQEVALPQNSRSTTRRPNASSAAQVTIEPCSVDELRAAFIAAREIQHMTKSDMAGKLDMGLSTLSRAESSTQNIWPTFFQSLRVMTAYTAGNASALASLDKKTHAAFFPQGLNTIEDAIYCLAYRSGQSIDAFGSTCGVERLAAKTNRNSKEQLSVRDRLMLRKALAQAMPSLTHLGVQAELADTLLPDPLMMGQETPFIEVLKVWSELACTKKSIFIREVGSRMGKPNISDSSLYAWGAGTGLQESLETIISVLKTNPNTKDHFPAHEQQFRESAALVMKKPKHAAATPATQTHAAHAQLVEHQRENKGALRR
jgi:transcriptional regulator with XRE-family HTH domain